MIVFLTGSAGLLGGVLAQTLTRRGHSVLALVHRTTEIKGSDGSVLPASSFDGEPPVPGAIKTVQGDVSKPQLGLSDARYQQLQNHIECMIHCAALVKFEAPFEELRSINVGGSIHAAQCFPDARFIHVSTAYTCGLKDGPIDEELHAPNGRFANGYERSKAIAEIELLKTRPAALVVRPSIVVGELESGQISSFDSIYRAFKVIAEGRISSVPVAPDATLNFVPIDFVAKALATLAAKPDLAPAIVHLTAKDGFSAQGFLRLIGSIPGLASPQIVEAESRDKAEASFMDRMVQPYWSYFTRSPEFSTKTLSRITGLCAPEMDEAALLRQIRFCVEAGYIRVREPKAIA